MILTVSNLTVARGGVAILAGINFVMVSGTALVVRGPNGSGKTSLPPDAFQEMVYTKNLKRSFISYR